MKSYVAAARVAVDVVAAFNVPNSSGVHGGPGVLISSPSAELARPTFGSVLLDAPADQAGFSSRTIARNRRRRCALSWLSYAILKSRVAWQRLIEPTMTVSSPMGAQAKGVAATIQMPKAMIPIEIRNENAASMLASIPKKERRSAQAMPPQLAASFIWASAC